MTHGGYTTSKIEIGGKSNEKDIHFNIASIYNEWMHH